MKSTGEVLGIGKTYAEALYKGFIAAKNAPSKPNPTLLLTLNDQEKLLLKKEDCPSQFNYLATEGTCKILRELGIPKRIYEEIYTNPVTRKFLKVFHDKICGLIKSIATFFKIT